MKISQKLQLDVVSNQTKPNHTIPNHTIPNFTELNQLPPVNENLVMSLLQKQPAMLQIPLGCDSHKSVLKYVKLASWGDNE